MTSKHLRLIEGDQTCPEYTHGLQNLTCDVFEDVMGYLGWRYHGTLARVSNAFHGWMRDHRSRVLQVASSRGVPSEDLQKLVPNGDHMKLRAVMTLGPQAFSLCDNDHAMIHHVLNSVLRHVKSNRQIVDNVSNGGGGTVIASDDCIIRRQTTLTSMVQTLCSYMIFMSEQRRYNKDRVNGEMLITSTDRHGRSIATGQILDSFKAHRDTMDLPACYDVQVVVRETFKWPQAVQEISRFLLYAVRRWHQRDGMAAALPEIYRTTRRVFSTRNYFTLVCIGCSVLMCDVDMSPCRSGCDDKRSAVADD